MNKLLKIAQSATESATVNNNIEFPIQYYRDDGFGLFFSIDKSKARLLLPSQNLHPLVLPNGRAVFAIFAYNYIETTIGSYGEIAGGIMITYGKKPSLINLLLDALIPGRTTEIGSVVPYHPVTKMVAHDIGIDQWGYNKFIADMKFIITPEYQKCVLHDNDQHVLDIQVSRKGKFSNEKMPLITYTVKDDKLIKTVIPQKGVKRISHRPKDSFLKLGDHAMAQSIKNLDISPKPFASMYYVEHSLTLSAGEEIEDGIVNPLPVFDSRSADGTLQIEHNQ